MNTELALSLSFSAPTHDPRFLRLATEAQDLVLARLGAMRRLAQAPKLEPEIAAIARTREGQRGWGGGTIRRAW